MTIAALVFPALALVLILSSLPSLCDAQAKCSASTEEGRVLCAASHQQDLSIAQVLAEDETAKTDPNPPSAKTAESVWTAAYDQWVKGSSGKKLTHSVVDKALREARKRFGDIANNLGASAPDAQKEQQDDEKDNVMDMQAEDDELALITKAVDFLSKTDAASEEAVREAVDTIDALCPSGDNGKQVASAGGVRHLLDFSVRRTNVDELRVQAVKALASCAQNNPPVVARAVLDGAIATLLDLAQGESVAMRAAALRALVALAEGEAAWKELEQRREPVARVVHEAVSLGTDGREERRCVVRALALAEGVLRRDASWARVIGKELELEAQRKLKSEDIDVKEGAAKVLTLLRRR